MNAKTSVSLQDLERMPRWACVAFAARCGRRVQPLLRKFWANGAGDLLKTFDQAIFLAEESATNGSTAAGMEDILRAAETYAPATIGVPALRPYPSTAGALPAAQIVRHAVALTAVNAARAAVAAGAGDQEACARAAFEAYGWAIHAALSIQVAGADTVMRYDLGCLQQAVERGEITDASPVAPDFFGLEKELRTYQRELSHLLSEQGKYVLIQDNKVAGTWQTYEDALTVGYERFGLTPFLVKRIDEADAVAASSTGTV